MDFSKIKEWLIPEGKVKSVSVDGKVVWKAKTENDQLAAPTIALDGDTLTMTATDDKTEEFVIFVDGVEKATVANECMESSPNTVSGTWYFNEVLNFPDTAIDEYVNCIGDYTNHGSDFNGVVTEIIVGWQYTNPTYKALRYFGLNSSNRTWHIVPYGENGWKYTDDRTITFDGEQSVSKEFYEWLNENAKRDEEPITFDLSTLNLSAGTHKITVKARASGYTDSPASDEVSYVVAGEQTYTVSGSWYFDYKPKFDTNGTVYVSFVSNGVSCKNIVISDIMKEIRYNPVGGDKGDELIVCDIDVYGIVTWTDEAYRTITFDGVQEVSKEFYEWLVANAERKDTIPIQSGTWVFNDVWSTSYLSGVDVIPLKFYALDGIDQISAGIKEYSRIEHDTGQLSWDDTVVAEGTNSWVNDLYKTIIIAENQTLTQEHYNWLVANATYAPGN